MKFENVLELRKQVLGNERNIKDDLDEAKRIKIKKTKGAEKVKQKRKSKKYQQTHKLEIKKKRKRHEKSLRHRTDLASLKRLGPSRKGTRRVTKASLKKPKHMVEADTFDRWMEDVNEAVDLFIGMTADVLPEELPWQQWYIEGMSATKAAKSAVNMCQDLEEDGLLGEGDDEGEDDFWNKIYLEDVGKRKLITYQDWYSELSDALSEDSMSLEELKSEGVITVKKIQGLYNKGYDPSSVAKVMREEFSDSVVSESSKVLVDESSLLAEELGVDISDLIKRTGSTRATKVELPSNSDNVDCSKVPMEPMKEEVDDTSLEDGFMDMIVEQTGKTLSKDGEK